MNHTIEELSINGNSSILDALKRMDAIMRKLLIVKDGNEKFEGIISIGDIQRAIIKSLPFSTTVSSILRNDFKTASSEDDFTAIKEVMVRHRMEYMPVVNRTSQLVEKIVFWEDLFSEKFNGRNESLRGMPVVIMAGGEGTRLRPITNIIPKPLVPIGAKPIIEIIIDNFYNHGAAEFYLSVNYKAKMIQQYFEDIDHDYKISYIHEPHPLGTAGSLKLMKEILRSTFFVSNCDILVDEDYSEILNYHVENKNILTAVAAVKNYSIPYGTFKTTANGILTELTEKPNLNFLVNTGFYILEPEVLNMIPDEKFFHITDLLDELIRQDKKIGVFPVSEGSWLDIGAWEEYNRTQKILSGKFPNEN
jgi:dTDP-glucose pyrophosphorylase